MKTWAPLGDFAALGCSAVCAIHCAILPIGFLFLPSTAALSLDDEMFHQFLVVLVIPISLIALSFGCSRHKQFSFFFWGLVGLALLALAAFFGHDLLGETGEKLATVAATGIISICHIQNYRSCRRIECDAHEL
ncbi:MAG: MerC domain-containing protein [Pseudomonadota bacterium]